jgi:hypothetical protein
LERLEEEQAAVAAYKERKAVAGIYAVRCTPSGEVWVGQALNLLAMPNRLSLALRHGSHPNRSLQAEQEKHGAASFAFEELERLEDEPIAYILDKRLKERAEHWRDRLDATPV